MAKNGKQKRKCKDWLTSYLTYAEEQESPDIFHLWCGISVISAALERNVYLDMGYFKVRPNLYIILVAQSAMDRKTTAIEIAEPIIKLACPDINFIAQKLSPEALLRSLSRHYKETADEKTGKEGIGSGYVIAEELSVLLGNRTPDASLVHLLTKAYNCSDSLSYETITHSKMQADNCCLNMLAGTTPQWIREALPPHAIAGGFAGRIIFVHPGEHESKRNALPVLNKEAVLARDAVFEDLKLVRMLEGEFTMTKKAKEWYVHWYEEVFRPDLQEQLLDGYYGRKHTTVLKIAMVLSASLGNSMMVDEVQVKQAFSMLSQMEKFLPMVMQRIQSSQGGDDQELVLRTIKRKGKLDYSSLLRAVSYKLKAQELQELILSLTVQGRLTQYGGKSKKGQDVRFYKVI